MDDGAAPVQTNKRTRAMWLVGIVVAVAVVFGLILGPMLKESITNPADIGHDHEHQEQGGGAPPPADGLPAGEHGPDDGHNH